VATVRQSLGTWIACLAIFLGGIFASFSLGSRLEADAHEHWRKVAETEANKITDIALFELSQMQSTMHAVEAKFANTKANSDEALQDILFEVDSWNLSAAPVVLGFVEKVTRNNRQSFEAANGIMTQVDDPEIRAPKAFENFVVTHSSDTDRVLRLNMDMTTHPKMKSAVFTASRMPNRVVLGPAFKWSDGHTYSIAGLRSQHEGVEGVIIGLLSLDDLYQGLVNVHIPEGMVLRLFEREDDGSSVASLIHVMGPENAPDGTAFSVIIRFTEGLARWGLNWDVSSNYHDGPNTGLAGAIRYGGSGLTILFSLFLGLMISRNTQIRAVVEERTHELNDEKERLRLALKGGDLGSWDVDFRTGETIFNARWADTLGYKIDEVENAHYLWRDTIHSEDRDWVLEIGRQYRAGEINRYDVEYRVVTKENEDRWVQSKGEAVEFDEDGMAIRMVGTMSDITQRKKIEKELEYQQTQLRALTDNLPYFVCMSDVEGRYKFFNRCGEEWMCLKRGDAIGKTVFDFYPEAEASAIRERDIRAIKSGEVLLEESDYLYPDGVERSVIMTRFPVKDSTGTVVGLGNINFDITERKRLEADLGEAKEKAEQANQAKSDFLASMSHELRTPLNAILGFSQLMEYSPNDPLTDKQKESVGYIKTGGHHLLSLINDILDLAKIEAGKADLVFESIPVLNIVDECQALISTLAEKRGITIRAVPDHAKNVAVRADHVRFNQVLLNLMSNAVKYNRDNGTITITFEKKPNGFLRINVTDTGNGIPDDKAGELFKPFSRLGAEHTDIEGTGIGLVVTKELVERMDGNLGFDSEVGVGTTFWVELPLDNMAQEKSSEDSSPGQENDVNRLKGVSGKLLYVEDDVLHAQLLKSLITASSDIDVTIAPTGQGVLDIVENLMPDIIFVDIKLPDMSGYDVVQRLKEIEKIKNIPIFALTVAATNADKQKGIEAGFTGYLTKPLRFEEITDTILKVV